MHVFLLVVALAAASTNPVSASTNPFTNPSIRIRGLSPAEQAAFATAEGLSCAPWAKVNDGFCDCPRRRGVVGKGPLSETGAGRSKPPTDEPGTGACGDDMFFCANAGSTPKRIAASFVNDGVCDCCDGGDEWISENCVNTCLDEGKGKHESLKRAVAEAKTGAEVARNLIANAATQRRAASEELAEKRAELARLAGPKEDAQAALDAAKEKIDITRASLIADGKLREHEEPETKEEEKIPEDDEDFEDEEDVIADEEDSNVELPAAVASDEPAPPSRDEVPDDIHEASKALLKELEDDRDAKQKELDDITAKTNPLDEKINSLQAELGRNYGDQDVYFPVRNECYKTDSHEYTYEMCLFKDVKQGSTNLGNWKDEENRVDDMLSTTEWKFTGGVKCWGGPDRSATVALTCGNDFALSDPTEPNRCEYALKFTTPAACTPEFLADLEAQLASVEAAVAESGRESKAIEYI